MSAAAAVVDRGMRRRVVLAVLVRPSLWYTALVQLRAFAAPGWWHRPPFLPVPDERYVQFRLETQYGADAPAEAHHVIEYLVWCREMRELAGGVH